MQIHRFLIEQDRITAIPEGERALLFVTAHALNEINTLNKLLTVAVRYETEPVWHAHAQATQALVVARVLLGKLYEMWEAIRAGYFATKLGQTYGRILDPESKAALALLKTYFGRKNLVKTVRHGFAFHYSLAEARKPLPRQLPAEELAMYLHESSSNSLFVFAEVALNSALLDGISPGEPEAAFEQIFTETSNVVDLLSTFGRGIVYAILMKHIGADELVQQRLLIDIGEPPAFDTVKIPFYLGPKSQKPPSSSAK